MKKPIFLMLDVDDTMYDQMQPFQMACREILKGDQVTDWNHLYQSFWKRSHEMFNANKEGTLSLEESRIRRISKAMEDCGIVICREQAREFQKQYGAAQFRLTLSHTLESMMDICKERGAGLGILTNGPYDHQLGKIRALGLERWVPREYILISQEAGFAKPDQRIFDLAKERMGLKNKCVYMIGDSYENDIASAQKAGWHTVWVNHRRRPLPPKGQEPDYQTDSEEGLKDLIVNKIL